MVEVAPSRMSKTSHCGRERSKKGLPPPLPAWRGVLSHARSKRDALRVAPNYGLTSPDDPARPARQGAFPARLRAEAHLRRALDILHDRLSRVTLSKGAI